MLNLAIKVLLVILIIYLIGTTKRDDENT